MTAVDDHHDTAEHDLRPRRSVLYLPGTNERALTKAATLPADALILDLEDAVSPDAKAAARDRVRATVADRPFGRREVAVRVNGLATDWFAEDLAAIATAGPEAVLVPKVGSAADVRTIEDALDDAGAPGHVRIWAMLETPAAVLHAAEICAASERLAVLVIGTNDLAKELRAEHVPGRGPLLPALSWCVTAARAAGKAIVDGVFNDLDDAPGFVEECRQGRAFGFDGKTVIHPRQIAPSNEAFAPDEAELDAARETIAGFEAAQAEGRAVATVRGRMVEQLHVDQARRALAQAEMIRSLHG